MEYCHFNLVGKPKRLKSIILIFLFIQISFLQYGQIIDHTCTNLQSLPKLYIDQARGSLHIAYEHTSHGSQVTDGMTGLFNWKGSTYAWNDGGLNGALDIDNNGITGGSDLGAPDWSSWAASTRTFLRNPANSDVNVVMWAWCGQVSTATESNINTYLSLMSSLESEFPHVKFVYMTGHLDGTGVNGNLNIRNQQIRNYCRNNNKILYDFADIESFNPDGSYFLDRKADDGCNYDSNGDGTLESNWATEWQNSHTLNADWFNCNAAHSKPLNGNLKAYAAWWLWARLSGWAGPSVTVNSISITIAASGGYSFINEDDGKLQLNATVLPANATNKNVIWSVSEGADKAVISSTGLLTALDNGVVTVQAAAADGSGVVGSLTIAISNQFIPVTSVTVSCSGVSPIISSDDGTLQLSAMVMPLNASNKAVTWSLTNETGQASISTTGLVTAESNGLVTAKATADDGSGISGLLAISISNQIIPVQDILVNTENGSTIIPELKGTLQLTAQVLPSVASVKEVEWSVSNVTGQAIIDQSGLVTALFAGTVVVTASAKDGSGINRSLDLLIRNSDSNPLLAVVNESQIKVPIGESYEGYQLSLYDLRGNLIESKRIEGNLCVFNSSSCKPGIYLIVLSKSIIFKIGKIVIPG